MKTIPISIIHEINKGKINKTTHYIKGQNPICKTIHHINPKHYIKGY